MKKSIPIVLLLLVGISALARFINPWTEAKMQEASDLIVVGTVTKVHDLDETNTTLWPPCKFRGVEATFAVHEVRKGESMNRTVVLHYYRFDGAIPGNGPLFVNLTANDKTRFLLYLVKDGVGRYAPVSGQIDPSVDAITVFPKK